MTPPRSSQRDRHHLQHSASARRAEGRMGTGCWDLAKGQEDEAPPASPRHTSADGSGCHCVSPPGTALPTEGQPPVHPHQPGQSTPGWDPQPPSSSPALWPSPTSRHRYLRVLALLVSVSSAGTSTAQHGGSHSAPEFPNSFLPRIVPRSTPAGPFGSFWSLVPDVPTSTRRQVVHCRAHNPVPG